DNEDDLNISTLSVAKKPETPKTPSKDIEDNNVDIKTTMKKSIKVNSRPSNTNDDNKSQRESNNSYSINRELNNRIDYLEKENKELKKKLEKSDKSLNNSRLNEDLEDKERIINELKTEND